MWPAYKGRDGCRTPMPWQADAADFGFDGSGAAVPARPWLPVAESQRDRAVDRQKSDADSLLAHYRHLIHWRSSQPALIEGDMDLLAEQTQVLAYLRSHRGERVLCAFNFSAEPARLDLPAGFHIARQLDDSGATGASVARDGAIAFEPFGVLFARLD
jgi:alpha-glucosidase